MIKNNIKLIIGFILGAIMFTSLGVCAATLINGKEVKYDNTNSKLSSTNVQDAIDELNNKATTKIEEARKECPDGYTCTLIPPKYYAFGLPTTASSTSFLDVITESGSNTFVKLEEEQLSVCIYQNETLECFKNNNYEEESTHVINVFGEDSCYVVGSDVICLADAFNGYAYSDGTVRCDDSASGHYCYVYSGGGVNCR